MVESIKTCVGENEWESDSHHKFICIQGNLEHVHERVIHCIINTQQSRAVLEGDELKTVGGAAILCSYINYKLHQKLIGS